MESGWIVFPLGLLSESPCDAEGHHIVAGQLANSLSVWTCVVICFDSIALSSISRPNLQVPLVKTNPEKSFLWLSMAVFAVAFRFCICSIALTPFLAISRLRCSTIESVSIPESPVERFKSWGCICVSPFGWLSPQDFPSLVQRLQVDLIQFWRRRIAKPYLWCWWYRIFQLHMGGLPATSL